MATIIIDRGRLFLIYVSRLKLPTFKCDCCSCLRHSSISKKIRAGSKSEHTCFIMSAHHANPSFAKPLPGSVNSEATSLSPLSSKQCVHRHLVLSTELVTPFAMPCARHKLKKRTFALPIYACHAIRRQTLPCGPAHSRFRTDGPLKCFIPRNALPFGQILSSNPSIDHCFPFERSLPVIDRTPIKTIFQSSKTSQIPVELCIFNFVSCISSPRIQVSCLPCHVLTHMSTRNLRSALQCS